MSSSTPAPPVPERQGGGTGGTDEDSGAFVVSIEISASKDAYFERTGAGRLALKGRRLRLLTDGGGRRDDDGEAPGVGLEEEEDEAEAGCSKTWPSLSSSSTTTTSKDETRGTADEDE